MYHPIRSRLTGSYWTLAAIALAVLTPGHSIAESVATVNGIEIDRTTLDFYLQSRLQKAPAQITSAERDAVLNELIDLYLLSTQPQAEELGNDARVKAQIEMGYRGALAQAVATDYLSNNPATDEEILEAYTAQMESAPTQQFKARHILVETQGAAISLIAELNGGADFTELAKTHSTGPSGPSGGDLGWFAPNQMVKPFADAVANLEDGAFTTEPVQTEYGWHVILREDSRSNQPPPLDSVRDTIRQHVEQSNFQRYLEELRANQGS